MRLKKLAYSYSQMLMDYLNNSGKEILIANVNRTRKIGDSVSEDEQINVDIAYYLQKEDLEHVTNMEINEEQWEDFYSYLKSVNIPDFDAIQSKLSYDALDDIKRSLPGENLDSYELERFNFSIKDQDYSDINFKLEARFTK